ncbi:MAG: efflux RND transporter permease subunit [Flavobacteriaceae bacterium]|nr:efflux RND transporter permease subunit [Flavobacteriaceae bacterium]
MGFWTFVSRIILKNRILILFLIAGATAALLTQTKYIRISNTEANMLPSDHPASLKYDKFLKIFGEEGNLIIIAVKDSSFFTPTKFNNWNALSKKLDSFKEVDFTFSLGDIQKLKKDVVHRRFVVEPLYNKDPKTNEEVAKITKVLFQDLPFFDNFLYNKKGKTIRTLIYLKKDIVNTVARKDFVLNQLNPIISKFEKDNNLKVHVSGMPYIRTMNAESIVSEIGTFVGLAFGVTALIFFFFFRSFRATLIAMTVVSIGVMWAFGIIGAFQYEVTVLTALIPPLIIVIGVPNAIFLINKYQQEIKNHGNKAKSLQRVISKIGNATLMTNVTTASGFATFIFTKSQILREFGIIASINIMVIFVLSLLLIPIIYSFMPIPKDKHLKHLETRWIEKVVLTLENAVRFHRFAVYATTLVIVIVSMIGVYMINVSGSLIDDMPKGEPFYKDIIFFENEFGGIMPLEIIIDTKKKKGVTNLSTLKRMEKLDETIDEIPSLSKSISILNLVKYSKQAFYNGNPKYYKLPTSQEKNFILAYTKNSNTNSNFLKNFVDSTGRYARMTTFMKDIGTKKMNRIEERLEERINKVFPKDKYEITYTGKALLFLKGTKYLTKNLVISLSLAILLIALFMAWMFRSFRMILISIIPNMLPLLMTAGIMGYIGVPIKPSTILVFSIAFGISVDDTIHFLAKYRQELQANNWKIKKSVYLALRETGVSMFYTSIVLFFGFLVFTASSFGGTIALGGLVSITLLFAMVSNLVLLPSLLLSLDQNIANKKVLKEPLIKIIDQEDDN